MLSHEKVWAAIDRLAKRNGTTPSGLARAAGLNPTTFNPSKRVAKGGRRRWPTLRSLAKILAETGTSLERFAGMVELGGAGESERRNGALNGLSNHDPNGRDPNGRANERLRSQSIVPPTIPLLGEVHGGVRGFFDGGGDRSWENLDFPGVDDEGVYALKVCGGGMEPLYRDGDCLVIAPNADLHLGDRVVLKTRDGEVIAKFLQSRGDGHIVLSSLNANYPSRTVPESDVEWMARVIWATQ